MFGKKKAVKVGDFYQIANNKLKKYGLVLGESVYVAGSSYFQEDERDPHNYRLKFVVAKLDDGDHLITDKSYWVDAKSLGIIPDYEQERLKNIYEGDFSDKAPD